MEPRTNEKLSLQANISFEMYILYRHRQTVVFSFNSLQNVLYTSDLSLFSA